MFVYKIVYSIQHIQACGSYSHLLFFRIKVGEFILMITELHLTSMHDLHYYTQLQYRFKSCNLQCSMKYAIIVMMPTCKSIREADTRYLLKQDIFCSFFLNLVMSVLSANKKYSNSESLF